jgi:predicted ABC-type exoprotein transport system permease subunit
MRIACRIPKATNTLSEYVITIAFPLQQWMHEQASLSRYAYIAFLGTNVTTAGKFRDVCCVFATCWFIGSVNTLLTAADEPLFISTDFPIAQYMYRF